MRSEGNTKAEMGGTRRTKDRAEPRRARLEGGWTVHKTQEDEEKKMRGQSGGEPPADGKGWANREGRHQRDEGGRAEKLLERLMTERRRKSQHFNPSGSGS